MAHVQRIAITGAAGFIGRHLVPILLERNHVVHAIVRDFADTCDGAVNHVVPSFSTRKISKALEECDTLIHLAWSTVPSTSSGQPLLELESNLIPSLQLINSLQDSPITRILFLSSGGAIPLSHALPLIPDGTPFPRSYYGSAKVAVEQFLMALSAQSDKSITIIRPTNLYGPRQPLVPGFGLISTLVDHLINNKQVTIWGDGSVRKDFLFISDLVELLVRVIESRPIESPAILEVGSGQSHSILEVVEMLELISGKKIERAHLSAREIDPVDITINLSNVKSATGWAPATPLQAGLEAVYEWAVRQYADK